jgi:hypothetical protein
VFGISGKYSRTSRYDCTVLYVVFFDIIEFFIGFILYGNGKSRMQNRMKTMQRQKERILRQGEIEWKEGERRIEWK